MGIYNTSAENIEVVGQLPYRSETVKQSRPTRNQEKRVEIATLVFFISENTAAVFRDYFIWQFWENKNRLFNFFNHVNHFFNPAKTSAKQ